MAKTVLITGGAVRVGREIGLFLADKGWNIAIHCNASRVAAEELAATIRAKGVRAAVASADLRDAEAVQAVVPELIGQGLRPDCLINNAALFEKDDINTITEASWRSHMETNLFACLGFIRSFAAHYEGDAGNVINISDGVRGWSVSGNFLSYSLSKMGLENATALLAPELAPRIRINAIAPGAMLEGKQDKQDTFAKLAGITPLKRTGSVLELCETVEYILGSPSLTGQVIRLAGGL